MAEIVVTLRAPEVPNYILHVVPPAPRGMGFEPAPNTDVADLPDAVVEQIIAEWADDFRANVANRRARPKESRT